MYLIKSLGPTNAPIFPGVSVPWVKDQIGLVSASVISFYQGIPRAFSILAGPGFSEVVAQAIAGLADIRLSTGICQLSGTTAPLDYAVATAAAKTYTSAGGNNDLTVTSKILGIAGAAYSVSCVQSVAISHALSVVRTGNAVVITLPSDGAGAPVATTANTVKVAWDASTALDLMTLAVEGSGAGTVAAFVSAPLVTGTELIPGTGSGFAAKGSQYIAVDTAKMYLNGGSAAEPAWKLVTSA